MRKLGLALVLVLFSGIGCSGTEKAICDRLRQCVGGNDRDMDACVQGMIYQGKVASDYGCGDAYHNWIACVESTSVCETVPILGTKYLKSTCSTQDDALNSCEKAASVRGDRHFLSQ